MFDHGERCLGNLHPLMEFLFGEVFSYLGRKLVALRCVGAPNERTRLVATDETKPTNSTRAKFR